ncbi:sulfotransferase [Roseospira navarrensis]|uniref:sulfotransferase n=1 Tax=Roseospira navarrensis TaxID=140058 RepID=UPI001478A898
MIALLWDSLTRYGSLIGAAWRPPPGRRAPSVRRVAVLLALLPLFTAVQAVHGLCLALDHLLFPRFRRVPVRAPVFILGVPRSGTTLAHRTLARDPALTTFSTWECLLAPSILQRRIVRGLAAADRRIGRPLGRLLGVVERRLFGALDAVHATALDAPEEDYLALLPVMACFILVVPVPGAEPIWQLATADRDMPPARRRRLMAAYRALLQRHLYVHGLDRRLLSKNAAFAGLAGALRETFPDARFIRCHRAPEQVVPSQLSSIQGGVRLFDSDPDGRVFPARMTDVLAFYYANLDRVLPAPGGPDHVVLDMRALKTDLQGSVETAYRTLGLPLAPEFARGLEAAAREARAYRSGHRYDARDFGLDAKTVAAVADGYGSA